MGLVLYADAELAPNAADCFLVIDGSLTVCAVSRHAERLLDVTETEAVGRHASELIVLADADAGGQAMNALILAAVGAKGPTGGVVVCPATGPGVRLCARLGSCGPPSAAVMVLAPRDA